MCNYKKSASECILYMQPTKFWFQPHSICDHMLFHPKYMKYYLILIACCSFRSCICRSVMPCNFSHASCVTPTDWYSKKQATVETATYGSEFVAAKTATEQIMDLRYTLSYLGVPIKSKSYMFGDNRSVVTSATLPHSTLSKRHNILAFHRVREAIAAKIIDFHWIQS